MNEEENIDIDLEIISRCMKGDVDTFNLIVTRYQKRMLNISYRMLGDYNDAVEVVQDAFISAYKNLKTFKGNSKFSTWLYAIVANLSRNRLKQNASRASKERYSIDDPVDTTEGQVHREHASNDSSVLDKLEKNEIQQRVQGCIDSLESEFKEVVVLRDMQGFSYDEISDMLSVAAGTVKSRIHRARSAVKDCLKKFIGEL